jgi:hypothetical protein
MSLEIIYEQGESVEIYWNSVFEGVFYTIDATELICKVGSGECRDRKTDNKAEDLAR